MPKLAGVVTDIGTVPETYRDLYTEQDGKFVLDADVEDHPAVGGLKSALKKERDRAGELDKKLKAFGELTADEAAELRELKKRQAEGGDGKDKPDLEALRKKWRKEVDEEYAPKLKKLDELAEENRKLKLDDRVRAAALKAGVIAEDIEDVMTITGKYFDLNEKGEIVVLDEDGDPSSLTLEKFFGEKFKKMKPKFYAGSGASGSGASGSHAAGGSGTVRTKADLKTAADKAKYIEQHGRKAYVALPDK